MVSPIRRYPARLIGAGYLLVSALATYLTVGGPVPLEDPGLGDSLYFLLIALHVVWGVALLLPATFDRRRLRRFVQVPDLLFAFALLLFLFAYVFAVNANMDYVQRFIESGG